jgi:phospholipid transport system substrate-binding protein
VQRLNAALIDVMKNAQELKFAGRYDKLQPVLANVFDIAEMTRVAIGPLWKELSETDRKSVIEVFQRYMTTMYAVRFNNYAGESFQMGDVKTREGKGILVMTKLNRKDQEPVDLGYLMRGEKDVWQAVDVYYNGAISQIAQLRSEFSAPLRDGGVANLQAVLEKKIAQLQA